MGADQKVILSSPASPQRHHVQGRMLVLVFVALLPAASGFLVLSPPRFLHEAVRAVQHEGRDEVPADRVDAQGQTLAMTRRRIDLALPVVFGAASLACLGVGLLGAQRGLLWAFPQACVATVAHMISDGQGAFLGPIVWTLVPFWPLVAIGRWIRGHATDS